jgi:hypothetical protein
MLNSQCYCGKIPFKSGVWFYFRQFVWRIIYFMCCIFHYVCERQFVWRTIYLYFSVHLWMPVCVKENIFISFLYFSVCLWASVCVKDNILLVLYFSVYLWAPVCVKDNIFMYLYFSVYLWAPFPEGGREESLYWFKCRHSFWTTKLSGFLEISQDGTSKST